MSVCCECCALLGRGLCDELITRPEEYYRLWFIVVCDIETSRIGSQNHNDKKKPNTSDMRTTNTKREQRIKI